MKQIPISSSKKQHLPQIVKWNSTRDQRILLNVVGSSFGNSGNSGFGGLLRRANGECLGGFAGSIGISNNLHAELLALYHGLSFAWTKGFRSLICYTDSQNALQLVLDDLNIWNRYASVIQSIKDMLRRNWDVRLAHTLREGNACADFLAKAGAADVARWTEFVSPPAGLALLLLMLLE